MFQVVLQPAESLIATWSRAAPYRLFGQNLPLIGHRLAFFIQAQHRQGFQGGLGIDPGKVAGISQYKCLMGRLVQKTRNAQAAAGQHFQGGVIEDALRPGRPG